MKAVLDQVRGQPQRRAHRIDISAARDVFLQDVVLRRPLQHRQVDATFLGHGQVEGEHDGGRGVDRHGHAALADRDAVEQHLHVFDRVDRDTDFSDRTGRLRRVRVIADLRGQVEGDGERLFVQVQQVFEALVGFLRRSEPRVGPDGPGPGAVHRGVDAARERRFAGKAQVFDVVRARQVSRRVQPFDRDVRFGQELGLALGRFLQHRRQRLLIPVLARLVQVVGDYGCGFVRVIHVQSRIRRGLRCMLLRC